MGSGAFWSVAGRVQKPRARASCDPVLSRAAKLAWGAWAVDWRTVLEGVGVQEVRASDSFRLVHPQLVPVMNVVRSFVLSILCLLSPLRKFSA